MLNFLFFSLFFEKSFSAIFSLRHILPRLKSGLDMSTLQTIEKIQFQKKQRDNITLQGKK